MVSESLATRTTDFLIQYPPFSYVERKDLQALAAQMNLKYFRENDFVFEEGEKASELLYILQKGQIEILKEMEDDTRIIDVCDSGDAFGVRSLLSGESFISSARVSQESLVYLLPAAAFTDLMSKYPRVSMYFASGLAAGMSIIREKGKKLSKARFELGKQANRKGLLREEDIVVFKHKDEVVFCKIEQTIKDAADIMTQYKIGSLVVANDQLHPVGIVTNVDFARKIGTGKVGIGEPITKIMSRPVMTIPYGETTAEVILTMMKHNIRHLVVTEDGTPNSQFIGIISEHDILQAQGNNPAVLAKRMMRARTVEQLAAIRDRAEELIHSYLQQEISISFITSVMTEINDVLIRKAVEMSLARLEEEGWQQPREKFCFMSLGSEGRGEQLLRTDQDNAIIYQEPAATKAEQVKAYFHKLGLYTTDILEACGFAHCPGEIMASNEEWNASLPDWKRKFANWMQTADPESLLHVSIFFDYRGIYGDMSLVDDLTDFIHEEVGRAKGFLNFFAFNATQTPPPLSFFRNFVVERGGKHKDEFDIKSRAMLPIADAARVLLLSHKTRPSTHTMERLEALASLDTANAEVYKEAAMAYGLMIRYRALNGLEYRNSGRFIHPNKLNKIEKQTLKYAFRTIEELQGILRSSFGLAVFR
ncbi:MAG: DUF294 nucleotidyltransferase-like domain-containing protein [Bacteroidota bacterium]